MTIEDIVDILSLDLIGVIPDDVNVVVATNREKSLIGSGTASGKAYENICRRIMGEEIAPWLVIRPEEVSFSELLIIWCTGKGEVRQCFLSFLNDP